MSLTIFFVSTAAAAALGGGGYALWRHQNRSKRCEALWREKKVASSLTLALECGRLDFIKASLSRLPVRHAALSDGLRQAAEAMILLLQMVNDPRNTYLPKSLRKQTIADSRTVLVELFNFAQRLHLVESQGHLPPQEEAAKVAASFASTTVQANDARAAFSKLTFSGSSVEFKSARNKVKAIAWQAHEMYSVDKMLE